jgi:hypothetical protein
MEKFVVDLGREWLRAAIQRRSKAQNRRRKTHNRRSKNFHQE